MNIINSILSFLLGADYEILQLCPTEYSKQRKRIFVALIIAVISYVSAGYILKQGLSAVIALVVLLFYIMFLCRFSKSTLSKILLTFAISGFVFWGISFPAFGGIKHLHHANFEIIVIAAIVGIVDLVLCFLPVNFSNGNESYAKLLKQKNANKEAIGKLLVDEKANADRTIIKNREAARVKLEADISKYMSDCILKSQKAVIDKIAQRWVKGLENEINNSTGKFCTYDKVQKIKINKVYEDELNNYISELLKDKREEFAKIIVEKWAEEKKKELSNNPNAYLKDDNL